VSFSKYTCLCFVSLNTYNTFQNFTEQISFADPTVINTNSGSALVFKYEYECQHSKNLLYINSKVLIA
jgi:hypothetical protein